MAWTQQGTQFYNPDTKQYFVPQVYGGAYGTGPTQFGVGNGYTGTMAVPTGNLVNAPTDFSGTNLLTMNPGASNAEGLNSGQGTGMGWLSDTPFGSKEYQSAKDNMLGDFMHGAPFILGGAGAVALGGAGAAGAGGITSDSIGAGMLGGENAAGAMYGAGAGATGAGTGATMGDFNLMDPSTWGLPSGVSDLPPTTTGMPGADTIGAGSGINAGVPTGSTGLNGDWWSQYGLSSDPTAASGGAGSSILNQIGSTLKSAGMSPGSLAQILGKLGAAGLGALGSNMQQNSLNNLAQQYIGFGAPSRARYESSMTAGFDPNSIPGYSGALDTASKGILARLSATGGNPYGNPGGLIDANKQIVAGTALPAIQEYQRMNANTGFGASMNAAVPLQTAAIGQQGNVLNSLGYGLNAITNPQPTLADQIRALNLGGFA